jgi:hypothetical protein
LLDNGRLTLFAPQNFNGLLTGVKLNDERRTGKGGRKRLGGKSALG